MKQKIEELIAFQKIAKEETRHLISVMKGTEDIEYEKDIEKHQIEYDLRSAFINQLEDII